MGIFDRCGALCGRKKGRADINHVDNEKSEKELEAELDNPNREDGRAQWASPTEFMLTCIGYSVGLGNVWRFPYLCYKNGGGAFLIPYIIMISVIGMPLLFMEYSFGQYFGIGSLSIFKKVCPMFQGIGIGYVILNGLVCVYYNVIIAIALYYLFASFQKQLPWGTCGNEWNTPLCREGFDHNNTYSNITNVLGVNSSIAYDTTNTTSGMTRAVAPLAANISYSSPSEEYYRLSLLAMGPEHDVSNLGSVRWHLCLCLLLAWILVVIFVSRGIQSTGKVAYFTATFPYVMLTVLVVRGVTLPGAASGILYFVTPDWNMLKSPDVWFKAATQLFYSTNLAWGGMITMSSYNKFNHNCYRDAIVINIVSFLTSLYAGFAVFSIIGYMAQESNTPVEKVIESGPGLAFVAYPRALSLMPLSQLWSALFFFMLFLLGIGSQMVLIETVVTGFVDEFPKLGLNAYVRFGTTCTVVVTFCLIGIPMTTQMVQVETIMTGFVDRWPSLAANWKTRIMSVVCVCFVGFLGGISMVTQMVDIETVMTGICDEVPIARKSPKIRFCLLLVVVSLFFLIGLPQTTQGGMWVLQLMDDYSAGFCVLVIAVVECFVINWIYGNDRMASNVKEMLGHRPGRWWLLCWKFFSPALILGILIFSFVRYERVKYGDSYYPIWADVIGWFLTLSSNVPIVIVAIYKLVRAKGNTLRAKFVAATRSTVTIEKKELEAMSHRPSMCISSEDLGTDKVKAEVSEEDEQKNTLLDEYNEEKNMV